MILTFDNVNFFFKFIRQFLASIDVVVFSLLSWMIEGVFNLSSLMLNADFAKQIYTRIYIILGIFMTFKLTFSFLKYLVSPDAMTDKEQGVGKLVGRVVAMIIMLIIFPIVFFNPVPGDSQNRTLLVMLQDGVVKTLPRIILGQAIDDTNASGGVNAKDNGKELALSMLKSFYYPSLCNEDSKNYDESQKGECQKYFAGQQATISSDSNDNLESSGIDSFKTFYASVINEGQEGEYAYQYMWPLTTVTGILLIVIMGGICIDVAIRIFKLLILEVMAPIPIMTYIDPKASKDGSFAAWSKSLISTYIDLFVKLGTVYLVLLLASALFSQKLFDQAAYNNFSGLSYLYVQVFLVLGLFQFAKQAPKFIKDALGIKDNGGGSGGFMGKALAGMAGAAAGFAGGVAGGGGIMGGLSAAAGGFSAGAANAGSGKPLGMYSKSRDEMAKSTGKIPGGVKGKIQQQALRRQLNKKFGLNPNTLAEAKKNMYGAQSIADAARDTYDRFKEGNMTDDEIKELANANGLDYDATTGTYYNQGDGSLADGYSVIRNALYDDAAAKQTAAGKAKSNYEKAAKRGEGARLEPGFEEENAYVTPYKAIKNSISDVRDKANAKVDSVKGSIHDKIAGSNGNKVREFVADHTIMSESQKRQTKKGGFDPNKSS